MRFQKWLCAASLVWTFAHSLPARTVFLTPSDPAGTTITIYTSDPFAFATTINGPTGAVQVLPSLSLNKFYAIGRSTGDTLAVLEGTYPSVTVTRRIALLSPATAATLNANGRSLAILAANGVHVLDTTTDQLITTGGPVPINGTPVGIVAAVDPNRVYALSSRQVTAVDPSLGFGSLTLAIPTNATSIALGPNGLLYVTAQDAIHEIDPLTLTIRNTTPLRGAPSMLSFTPDGRAAIAVNTASANGVSAYYFDTRTRRVFELPSAGVAFDKVVVVNNTTAYALSSASGRAYSLALAASADTTAITGVTPLTNNGAPIEGLRDITASGEGDRKRFVFLATGGAVYRYEVSSGTLTGPVSAPASGNLSFVPAPTTGGAASQVQLFNQDQTVATGQTSLPLVVRALDSQGNPVANVPVTFTSTTGGLPIVGSPATTNIQGYAQGSVQVPVGFTSGSIVVTPTVGSFISNTLFTITVNASGTGGTGTGTGTGSGTGTSQSGGLTVIQGQGQVLPTNGTTSFQEPLIVQLKDAQGNAVANQPITWTIVSGQGNVIQNVSNTDANGRAQADFVSSSLSPGVPYIQSVVQATTGVESVSFYLTTVPSVTGGGFGTVNAFLNRPTDRIITARAGEVLTNAVEIIAVNALGNPLPNVGLRVFNTTDPSAGATGSCRGGYVLTNEQGIARCDFIAAGSGEGVVSAVIGSQVRFDLVLRVQPGGASTLSVLSGNNQSGGAGQPLSGTLVAVIRDANGNPVAGSDVVFEVVTPGTATLRNTISRSDAQGRVSTDVTLGSTVGAVQIRVRSATGTASTTFNLTVGTTVTQIDSPGGDAQTSVVGQAFAQPLQVRLRDAAGAPVAGTAVTFAVVSGTATLASSTATTNAQGIVSTTVTAGQTAGAVVVQATAGALSTRFNLTIQAAGPGFTATSIVNGASFQRGISPGSVATIFATGIAPNVRGTVTPGNIIGPLPTRLSDVEVLFNGISAPIYSVSNINGQESVTVQVPFEVSPGTASVTVRATGSASTTVDGVPVLAISPGVFETTDPFNGRRYAVAYRADGSSVTSNNPARSGDIIRIFATGLGAVAPGTGTNRIGTSGQTVNAPVIVGLNNQGIRLQSAEYLPGTVGVYVISFEVPQGTGTSVAAPVGMIVTGPDGQPVYANGTTIPVQ